MKVTLGLLNRLHLDRNYSLLSGRSVLLLKHLFDSIDVRGTESLDDVQFTAFMLEATTLRESHILQVFDLFDIDSSGFLEFDEFYLLCCMLIAAKDNDVAPLS
eukprot:gnl/Ergobibamus_cyprinoides/1726.p4 GENE.gnl/Ergobibamus_cyprinoides/1726~~gnl/Ergobibamus_cyprinoides/1726.p4  ORF type:complete len:103 (+),score=39.93 gnl/Ergobibamus_cyprinoides/1726:104-412(+)